MLDDALDGPVNVVAPEAVTMATFARTLGRVMGRPAALAVPGFALRLALGEGLAKMLLTGQRAAPAKLLSAGFAFECGELEDALRRVVADLGSH
jgi:NAD dependent epimerase/dehydratase family enzyme